MGEERSCIFPPSSSSSADTTVHRSQALSKVLALQSPITCCLLPWLEDELKMATSWALQLP